jgi:hypothetical protein
MSWKVEEALSERELWRWISRDQRHCDAMERAGAEAFAARFPVELRDAWLDFEATLRDLIGDAEQRAAFAGYRLGIAAGFVIARNPTVPAPIAARLAHHLATEVRCAPVDADVAANLAAASVEALAVLPEDDLAPWTQPSGEEEDPW